jgi:hypothetical protein
MVLDALEFLLATESDEQRLSDRVEMRKAAGESELKPAAG